MTTSPNVVDLGAAGVRETELDESIVSSLPPNRAPAPWIGGGHGIWWGRRVSADGAAVLKQQLPEAIQHDANPVAVLGFLLNWTDTPVGSYGEIGALVVMRRGWSVFGHVPFIAVDSPASLVGGRDNWAIPKTLATFDGDPGRDAVASTHGKGYTIRTERRALGPVLPAAATRVLKLVQARPTGTLLSTRPTSAMLWRPARFAVTVEAGPELSAWLPQGECRGIVVRAMRVSTG
ncbi:acetoacetate decarboxylase family protein [Mycolicibacterium sp. CBMA 226]|uniref:acetoacetate decarboxylase family protein n=1 Tax=Mycolicibacterium sp. CBMA 226 TaxID=2606611 RepID=UPI0014133F12|nr:acetoacetate decarboxylase family protein [Mycolicibacterium sp. CBMA 226]